MPWRYRRSVRIAPGVRLNFGKRGTSLSIGGHGITTTYGPTGTYTTVSIPGTGLSYRQKVGGPIGKSVSASANTSAAAAQPSMRQYAFNGRLEADGSVTYLDENNIPASPAMIREIRRQARDTILQWLKDNAQEYNAPPLALAAIHTHTPAPLDAAHWLPPAFPVPQPQPPVFTEVLRPAPPTPETPGWFATHIPPLAHRVERHNAEHQQQYEAQVQAWQEAERKAEEDYAQAELAWETKIEAWETQLAAFDADQMQRRQMLTAPQPSDEQALAAYLVQQLAAVSTARPFTVRVSVAGCGRSIGVVVIAPNEDGIDAPWPRLYADVSYDRLRIYYKQKLKRQVRAEFLAYLASLGFRTVGEVFAALPVADVVTLEMQSTSGVPGAEKGELRTRIERSKWSTINFSALGNVDPAQHLAQFRY